MSERGKHERGKVGRRIWVVLAILGVVAAEVWADPGANASSVDRIFSGAFVAFAVGFVELFLALIALVILGKIDLPKVFQDKETAAPPEPAEPVERDKDGAPTSARGSAVSLSRLQAFLWTLVIMIVYFHKAVSSGRGDLPTIPSELLLLMGISGAVYLAGKELGTRDGKAAPAQKPGDAPGAAMPGGKPDGAAATGKVDAAATGKLGVA